MPTVGHATAVHTQLAGALSELWVLHVRLEEKRRKNLGCQAEKTKQRAGEQWRIGMCCGAFWYFPARL